MASVYEGCEIPYSSEELSHCRASFSDATDQELDQCASQDEETIKYNLQIKAGSDDPCAALEEYRK